MATVKAGERDEALAGEAKIPVAWRTRRRDEVEALGLLVGILVVLLALAVTSAGAPVS
jgi:uncharacterized membrane protein